jgi:hypothetical protein
VRFQVLTAASMMFRAVFWGRYLKHLLVNGSDSGSQLIVVHWKFHRTRRTQDSLADRLCPHTFTSLHWITLITTTSIHTRSSADSIPASACFFVLSLTREIDVWTLRRYWRIFSDSVIRVGEIRSVATVSHGQEQGGGETGSQLL